MKDTTGTAKDTAGYTPTLPIFKDLLTQRLQGVENTEVVVSITALPPHTRPPAHWHPGEEFAYVLDGSLTLHQEGKPDEYYKKGDTGVVPLKAVHTISTRDEGATILIFRVHELGQPGRILVD